MFKHSKIKRKKRNNEMGSVTIEATITFSITLFLLLIAVGTVFSVHINERMHEIAMEITSEMQLFALSAQESDDAVVTEVNELFLENFVIQRFEDILEEQGVARCVELNRLDTIVGSQLDTSGVFSLKLYYRFKMPTVLKSQVLNYPIIGVIHSDGLKYETKTVYITRTGEKYHEGTCHHLSQSKIAIDLNEAQARGIEACKNCHKILPIQE
ncbi:hypothetical protein [Fusibacter sp. 3D3]|uniref:hypothetical protein n=1 Tax=Fusibacter sp. 3D3 TaxID=1048380 RepID=UPI0008538CF8|nr:hypothetical protein [Fusibacter sp. 3D3]GAU78033.1 hypothetical protein F3D3_2662 [Fusibacter sp. 3D3]